MDRLIELKQAKLAAQEVIFRLDNAIQSLDSAKNWGIFDMLGGGMFASLFKREKIRGANDEIHEVSRAIRRLNKELSDIDMHLPMEISDSMGDNFFDVWFDNIFTDMRVQGEITSTLRQLKGFRTDVEYLIRRLDIEIDNYR